MNCLIYARVSTERQADKELSIPAQLAACRQYASQRNWLITREFLESGVSARTADRPVLHELLSFCRDSDQIKIVLVHKIDRLARNVADHAMIRALLRRRGVRLASVVENLDDSVSGQLVEHIMAAIAEFHSSNLSEEVKKGMRQKVIQGGWPHLPPRGYCPMNDGVRSSVQVHATEGPLMTQAFQLYSTGWYSMNRLAAWLGSQGLRSRSGAPLSHSHLRRLLENPFYCGHLAWNGLRVPGNHQPLIADELFDRVQEVIRTRRKQRHLRAVEYGHVLRAIGRCATCHGNMTSETHRGHWSYYRCSRQMYRRDRCNARLVRIERAHESFEQICRTISVDVARSLWDVLSPLCDADRFRLVGQLFAEVVIAAEGVVGFTLQPLWIQAILERQRLLNVA